MSRDYQRKKVYKSEFLNEGLHPTPTLTLGQCDLLVQKMYQWGKENISESVTYYSRIEIRDGRGRRSAASNGRIIWLPKFARSRMVVAHEVAHSLAGYDDGHGERFVAIYLQLVKKFDKENYIKLNNNFNTNKVKTLSKDGKAVKVRAKQQKKGASN